MLLKRILQIYILSTSSVMSLVGHHIHLRYNKPVLVKLFDFISIPEKEYFQVRERVWMRQQF